MPNPYFQFKQFIVHHDRCAMKVTTDGCLFGAWCASQIQQSGSKVNNLMDIGTGTGLLSLMIAQKNNIHIDAVEIDREAAAQAAENFRSSPWKQNISLFCKDILGFHAGKKYDCIISNPPFYENELASGQQAKDLAHHSSHLNFSQLLNVIAHTLAEDGFFFLLIPFKRIQETEKLLHQHQLFIHRKVIVKQSVAHQPFRVLLTGSKNESRDIPVSNLAIRDEKQEYTPEFTALLKDYYLHL